MFVAFRFVIILLRRNQKLPVMNMVISIMSAAGCKWYIIIVSNMLIFPTSCCVTCYFNAWCMWCKLCLLKGNWAVRRSKCEGTGGTAGTNSVALASAAVEGEENLRWKHLKKCSADFTCELLHTVITCISTSLLTFSGRLTLCLRDTSPTGQFAYCLVISPTGHFAYWSFRLRDI